MAAFDYDTLAKPGFTDTSFPVGREGPSHDGGLSAAFLAVSRRNLAKANALFDKAMLAFPKLPPNHGLWTRVTAFAALPGLKSDREFIAMLGRRGMLHLNSRFALPLPARTNFLTYCVRHKNFALALDLVAHAGPKWMPAETHLEAWAFRIAILRVLENVGDHRRLAAYCDAYKDLLESAGMAPLDRLVVELHIALLEPDTPLSRTDSHSSPDRGDPAPSVIDAVRQPGSHAGVLLRLLQRLTMRYLTNGNEARFRKCCEHLIEADFPEGYRRHLIDALDSLASALTNVGRMTDAAAVRRRAMDLIDQDASIPKTVAIPARIRLGKALATMGEVAESASVWHEVLLEATIALGSGSRESESSRRRISTWLAEARLELAPADEFISVVWELGGIQPNSIMPGPLLGLVTSAANRAAKGLGHAASEARRRYMAVATLLDEMPTVSSPDVSWRALMSLLTHWRATRTFADGLATLEMALTLPWSNVKRDRKRAFIDRASRLFAVRFGESSQDDLVRAVELAIAIPGRIALCSNKLSMAIADFLLKTEPSPKPETSLDREETGEAIAIIGLSRAVAARRYLEAVSLASRFMQEFGLLDGGAEYGGGLGVSLRLLSAAPRVMLAPSPHARRLAKLIEIASLRLNAEARRELSRPIAVALSRLRRSPKT